MLLFSKHLFLSLFTICLGFSLVMFGIDTYCQSINHSIEVHACCDLGDCTQHSHHSFCEDNEISFSSTLRLGFLPILLGRAIPGYCHQFSSSYISSIWQPPKIS